MKFLFCFHKKIILEASGDEMKKILLLLVGCAVQSDKKEEFINKIKELDLSLQESIVSEIRKVTEESDYVLNIQALELDPSDKITATVLHQLQRVVRERDTYAQVRKKNKKGAKGKKNEIHRLKYEKNWSKGTKRGDKCHPKIFFFNLHTGASTGGGGARWA